MVALALVLTPVLSLPLVHAAEGCMPSIDAAEARALAARIWRNEGGGDPRKLLWWNEGEDFASLGIGHFIWYPPGLSGPFEESFPSLLGFLAGEGVELPPWLAGPRADCPWRTRAEFLIARDGEQAGVLEALLIETQSLQARFILQRMDRALPRILAVAEAPETIRRRFCALAASPAGRYALTDYVNFKGEGVNPAERYRGEGWGLLQVLAVMDDSRPPPDAFAAAAARILGRRIELSPPERGEQRWWPGWLRRVEGYRRPPE